MAWHSRLINSFSRSFTDWNGERLDCRLVAQVVEGIDGDAELSEELEGLEEEVVHRRFLEIYHRSLEGPRQGSFSFTDDATALARDADRRTGETPRR